jgi:DNA-binding MarR family transcriptional regulator
MSNHSLDHNRVQSALSLHKALEQSLLGGLNKTEQGQFKLLQSVAQFGSCTLNQLAQDLGITAPSASEMVEKAVQKGDLLRWSDPTHRRRLEIRISRQGEAKRQEIANSIEERIKAFENFPTVTELQKLLQQIQAPSAQAPADTTPPTSPIHQDPS